MAEKVEIKILLKSEEAKKKLEEMEKEQERVNRKLDRRRAGERGGSGGGFGIGGRLGRMGGGRGGKAGGGGGGLNIGSLLLIIIAISTKIIDLLGYVAKAIDALGFSDLGAKLDQLFAGLAKQQDRIFNLFGSISQAVDVKKKFSLSGQGQGVDLTELTSAFNQQAVRDKAESRARGQQENVDLVKTLVQQMFGSQ